MGTAVRTIAVLALSAAWPANAQHSDDREAIAELRRMVEAQAKEIAALKAQLAPARPAAPAPVFKGSPEQRDGDWRFKVRGRLQLDTGYLSNPRDAVPTKDFGFSSNLRRVQLGFEGSMPGGFEYKAEANFADNEVVLTDAYLEWAAGDGPLFLRAGHFQTFQSLEQVTSSRHISFLERAQMNEGFNHGRRLGGAIGLDSGAWLITAGLFNDTVNADVGNDDRLFAARIVYAPKFDDVQLHLGANVQDRRAQSDRQNVRYRFRNAARLSDVRLVDTGAFAASGDRIVGLEAAGIRGPLHVAAEVQWAKASALQQSPSADGDSEAGAAFIGGDPQFVSWYVEAGWWLTGETRGYRKGEWDRTRVKAGIDRGGPGAIGINLRFDRLDLRDPALAAGKDGSALKGGRQDAWLASFVWQPIDYVKLMTQYNRNRITGGPFAGVVVPDSERPLIDRSYDQDSIAMRIQYDF